MAIVKGRHIRHDWRTFNDRQDQKSVRTLCNRTSTVRSSGIPTVTEQKNWLVDSSKGEQMWGWCWICTKVLIREFQDDDIVNAHSSIAYLYASLAKDFVEPAVRAFEWNIRLGNSAYSTPVINLMESS